MMERPHASDETAGPIPNSGVRWRRITYLGAKNGGNRGFFQQNPAVKIAGQFVTTGKTFNGGRA
jgi:hypothetical protein